MVLIQSIEPAVSYLEFNGATMPLINNWDE